MYLTITVRHFDYVHCNLIFLIRY